ncbi:hypothetical protein DEO72_LG3g275 [Vigna unguiculata]|uniref:Uncharacterized protein n=1 Tax=Vigna unguiculata TaxID=3917 RepID=A0A4D6LBL7_VIGUN|nr:hypothetical protein DEO72_LG3g275 [Vigna unguiculata]
MYLLFFSSLVCSEGCGASVVSVRLQLAMFPGVYWLDVLFWTSGYDCYRKTVARPVNLARASQSRLGKMNRELAQDFCAKVHNSLGSLGETFRVALQWSGRNFMVPVSGCSWWCPICITGSGSSSSGVSRGIHHKCKHPLNPTKLYDALLGFLPMFSRASSEPVPNPLCSEGCGASVVSVRLQLAMFPGVYWLDVLFWTSGYDCYRKTVARPVNLARASQSRLGKMNRELAQDFCAKVHNSLGSLGETFRVALQWSGRNFMVPVSGCSWWCPICITGIEQLGGEQRYPPQVQASAESD